MAPLEEEVRRTTLVTLVARSEEAVGDGGVVDGCRGVDCTSARVSLSTGSFSLVAFCFGSFSSGSFSSGSSSSGSSLLGLLLSLDAFEPPEAAAAGAPSWVIVAVGLPCGKAKNKLSSLRLQQTLLTSRFWSQQY